MFILQDRVLLENGKVVTDKNGFIKLTEKVDLTKEEWIELVNKTDKVIKRAYALVINYHDYQYTLRIGNERMTDKTEPIKWIEKHWDKYEKGCIE